MLLNFTNHPSSEWQKNQLDAAEEFGGVLDFPFPSVEPQASSEDLQLLVARTVKEAMRLKPTAVLLAGDYTMAFMLVDAFLKLGVKVVASTTLRRSGYVVNEDGSVTKTTKFDFVRFREYAYFRDDR